MFDHIRNNSLGAIKNAFQIHSDNCVESFFAHLTDNFTFFEFDKLAVTCDSCIINEDVDATIAIGDFVDPSLNFLAVDYVDFPEAGIVSELFGKGVSGFFINVTNNNFRTFSREFFGCCFANSCSTTGDNTYFIFQ